MDILFFNLNSSTGQQISLTYTHTQNFFFTLFIYAFVNLEIRFSKILSSDLGQNDSMQTFQYCILVVLNKNLP